MAANDFFDEAEYRSVISGTFDRVERAFAEVDPDIAECALQFGALSITFPNGQKCILSAQPSVQQLWMAVAAKGIAHHFDYDRASGEWRDDKGQGIEALAYLKKLLKEQVGIDLK